MKSALKIVAFTNASETDGTIALLEVAIAAMVRSGFTEPAEIADLALTQFIQETIARLTDGGANEIVTRH